MSPATITLIAVALLCGSGGLYLILKGQNPKLAIGPVAVAVASLVGAVLVGLI